MKHIKAYLPILYFIASGACAGELSLNGGASYNANGESLGTFATVDLYISYKPYKKSNYEVNFGARHLSTVEDQNIHKYLGGKETNYNGFFIETRFKLADLME